MWDSRKLNNTNDDSDQSIYEENTYHAWSKGDGDGQVERCEDGSYHRSCKMHDSSVKETTYLNTNHKHNPTGIGAGYMYIGPDLKTYRSSYTSSTKEYKFDGKRRKIVFIGRPIKCDPAK